MDSLHPHALIIFTRSTGKIRKCADTKCGFAMLVLYAMEIMTSKQDAIIIDKTNGEVVRYLEGTESGVPNVSKSECDELGHCDDYCPGLYNAIINETGYEEEEYYQ